MLATMKSFMLSHYMKSGRKMQEKEISEHNSSLNFNKSDLSQNESHNIFQENVIYIQETETKGLDTLGFMGELDTDPLDVYVSDETVDLKPDLISLNSQVNSSILQDDKKPVELEIKLNIEELSVDESIPKTQMNTCNICGYEFTDCEHLMLHRKEGCHGNTNTKKEKPLRKPLTKHKRIHLGKKSYICRVCGKSYTNISNLQSHERVHTGEKLYSCNVCHKSFSQRPHLSQHEIIHTGVKPFCCSVCKKTFSQSGSLTRHKRVHSGEKPFKCGVCNRSFSEKGDLSKHGMIHTGVKPFSCSECDRSFARRTGLSLHYKVHTGEKPFCCSECGKSFTQGSALLLHKRIHSGEKPFICTVCGKSFTGSGALSRHRKIHD